jgi:hypothetical protein
MVRTARFSAEHFIDAAISPRRRGWPGRRNHAGHRPARRRPDRLDLPPVRIPVGHSRGRLERQLRLAGQGPDAAVAAGRPREAALALLPWAGEDRHRARFLLLHEPVSLFEDAPPPEKLRQEMERLEGEMDQAFRACTADRFSGGTIREEDLARAKFLIFDAPIAILRPHLQAESAIPGFVGQMIAELHAGVPFASASPHAANTRAA